MFTQRIMHLVLLIVFLISFGTFGFCIIEGWPLADALYMTVITISTVGFGEMRELTPSGRAFTSSLILISIVCMTCWTAKITSFMIEGDITGLFRKQRMKRMAMKLKDHVIICGSGVYAQSLIDLLYSKGKELLVLSDVPEENEAIRVRYPGIAVIEDSPVEELALAHANLVSAEYVVVATESDIDNLLIAMSCKQVNKLAWVYAFCLEGNLAGRMKKVGVNEVICPHLLGGSRVLELMGKNDSRKRRAPLLAEFLGNENNDEQVGIWPNEGLDELTEPVESAANSSRLTIT